MANKSLYERLGGYDAIAAVCGDLLPRLQDDSRLARFSQNRGEDGVRRTVEIGTVSCVGSVSIVVCDARSSCASRASDVTAL